MMKKKAFSAMLAILLLIAAVLTGCGGSSTGSQNAGSGNTGGGNAAGSSGGGQNAGSQPEATDYPTKPIEIVVPFAAGGGTDLSARAMAEYVSKEWGQPVNVVNKPGAGGATATVEVLSSGSKEGYSILTQSVSAVSALYAGNPDLPFKMEDLRYFARLAVDPLAYVVKADAPWKDLKEFNEWVKQNPDQLTFASNGKTAIATYGVIQWMDAIGADFSKAKLVATNGSGDALPKVAGGHIVLGVQGVSEAANLVKAGKLKILGIAAKERSPYFPDVPTMEEQGVSGITVTQWYGISAPAGVPDAVVKKWESTVDKMLKDEAFLEKFKSISVQPGYLNSADFTNHVKEESAVMRSIVEAKGLIKK